MVSPVYARMESSDVTMASPERMRTDTTGPGKHVQHVKKMLAFLVLAFENTKLRRPHFQGAVVVETLAPRSACPEVN